jgi:hypothetical protein
MFPDIDHVPAAPQPACISPVPSQTSCETGTASRGSQAVPDATEITVIASIDSATKTFTAKAGRAEKSREPSLSKGTARRLLLSVVSPLGDLSRALGALGQNEVLACGAMTAPGDNLPLTTKDRLADEAGAITRTKGWASYPPGRPALVVLDIDTKDLPPGINARVAAAGGLTEVLASVCPEFARTGLLDRPSVSTGIRIKSTGAVSQGGGRHLYFVACNGADVRRFVACLHQRLILAGWGWVFITKAGAAHIRSLIDTAASGDPERLVFEADAVLDGADIEHVPGARDSIVHRDGVLLDTKALADLSPEEAARIVTVETSLLASQQPEIDRVRAQITRERTDKLTTQGVPAAEARARASRSFDSMRLDLGLAIEMDDGRRPTVADILRDPGAYNGATGADPMEPDYGGGKDKAIWSTIGNRVVCHSQAHGGQRFEAGWTASDVADAWKLRRDADEIADMLPYMLADNAVADAATLEAAGVPTGPGLDFGRDVLTELRGLVAREEWPAVAGLKRQLRGQFDDELDVLASLDLVDGDRVRTAIALVPRPGTSFAPVAPAGAIADGWAYRITRNKNGQPHPTVTNAVLALGAGCGLEQHLRWDYAILTLVVVGVRPGSGVWKLLGLQSAVPAYTDPITGVPVFQWTDALLTTARMHLERWEAGIASKDCARDAISVLGQRNAYSSVSCYLRAVQWDGTPRLDGWLVRHAKADDTPFNAVVLLKWMVGAVARALSPEERGGPAQMDTVLTFVGEQAARKSTFFRALCAVPNWHTENALGDLSNKDAVLRINAAFVVDMAEGGSVRANEVEALKQFITAPADSVRLPYASTVTRLVRRNVFAMTVNPDGTGFLKDVTGNRRFWVVEVGDIDIARLKQERDQLWAEAVARFDAGEIWWFDKNDPRDVALEDAAAAAAEAHRSQTPVEFAVHRYVTDAPTLDHRGRVSWVPRPVPLSFMGSLPDVLAEVGQDGRSTNAVRDGQRALTGLGWVGTRVNFRSGPVARGQTIWVNPDGAAAIKVDRASKGNTTGFRQWLDAEHKKGSGKVSDAGGNDTAGSNFADAVGNGVAS